MRSAALVVLAACWTAPPRTEPVGNVATPPPTAKRRAVPQHSVWRGSYTCAQGLTSLTLTLDVNAKGEASALFEFGPNDDNPNIPPGVYRLIGTVRTAGDILQVRLDPDGWLDQPPGYMMVGLGADSDRSWRTLDGWITNPSCAEVSLARVR